MFVYLHKETNIVVNLYYLFRRVNNKSIQMKSQNQTEVSLSFNKGFRLLNDYQKTECKRDIMLALNITSDQGFGKRRNGKVKHDVISAKKIEQAFAKHGLRPCNVWGD